MNINNVELEADFLDADFMERYEAAAAEMQERANAAKERKWARSSDAMKEICAYINEFFDAVFGAGTAEKIFGGRNNVGDHFDAFEVSADVPGKETRPASCPDLDSLRIC